MKGEYEKWTERLAERLAREVREVAIKDNLVQTTGDTIQYDLGEIGWYKGIALHTSTPQDVSRCRKTCPSRTGGACDC